MLRKVFMLLVGMVIAWMGYGLLQTSPSGAIIITAICVIWWLIVWTQFASIGKDREEEKQVYWSLVEILKSKGFSRNRAIQHLDKMVQKRTPRDEIVAIIRSL